MIVVNIFQSFINVWLQKSYFFHINFKILMEIYVQSLENIKNKMFCVDNHFKHELCCYFLTNDCKTAVCVQHLFHFFWPSISIFRFFASYLSTSTRVNGNKLLKSICISLTHFVPLPKRWQFWSYVTHLMFISNLFSKLAGKIRGEIFFSKDLIFFENRGIINCKLFEMNFTAFMINLGSFRIICMYLIITSVLQHCNLFSLRNIS